MTISNNKERQSNIELLRIVAIIMIIAHHLSLYGGAQFDYSVISVNRLWNQFLIYGGHVGVNVFVLISGYFMINKSSIKLSKVTRLWMEMLFYSVTVYLVAVLGFGAPFSIKYLGISFIPVLYKQWPFASAYLLLFVLAPFINIALSKLTKSKYRLLLIIMGIMWVMVPTISTFDGESNYLIWVIAMYAVGAYIRLFPDDFKRSSSWYINVSLVLAVISFASAVVLDILGLYRSAFAMYATHFSGMQHLNIVLWSIALFVGVCKSTRTYKNSKAINYLASLTFGVYLLHEDFFARYILWNNIFNNEAWSQNKLFILYTIMEIAIIFVVGLIVELLRQKILEPLYMGLINRLLSKPQKKIDEILNDE